jgi:hypothetical protein
MGTYISFHLGAHDGLKSMLFRHIDEVLQYVQRLHMDYPEDYSPELISMLLKLKQHGEQALQVSTQDEALLVDEAVLTFLSYLDIERHDILEDIPLSHMKAHNYAFDLADVYPLASETTCRLYNKALGKSISLAQYAGHKWQEPFFHISWLLPDEVLTLKIGLERCSNNFEGCNDDDEIHGVWNFYEALKVAEAEGTSLIIKMV